MHLSPARAPQRILPLLAVAVLSTSSRAEPTPRAVSPERFQVVDQSASRLNGGGVANDVTLTFESRLVWSNAAADEPTEVELEVRVDETRLTGRVDLRHRTAVLDGHGGTLTRRQIVAMHAIGRALELRLTANQREPLAHEDFLYRLLSVYAMLPSGTRLGRIELADDTSVCPSVSPGSGPICGGGDKDLSFCSPIVPCFGDNGDGICYLDLDESCQCAYFHAWHDAELDHCFCRETQGAGCDLDAGCKGRGGALCDGGVIFGLDCNLAGDAGAGTYTIDFLEHDRCCEMHDAGGLCDNIVCLDEAEDALDDCLFGTPNCGPCVVCGDGICEEPETCATCSRDCQPACGNGCCDGAETNCSCPADCAPACGDGCCSGNENPTNCRTDCDPKCDGGPCESGESTCNCPSDCGSQCGDGCCNGSETPSNCCTDCGGCSGGGLELFCDFIEDRDFCRGPDENCRNDGDPFLNIDEVFLNVSFENTSNESITYQLRATWYDPDGNERFEWTSDADFLLPGWWACWWLNYTGFDECAGEWRVRLDIRETTSGGFGDWRSFVNKTFDMRFDGACSSDAECDDGNPCTTNWCDCTCQSTPNDLPCDDGVFCNGSDRCAGGSCSMHLGDPCSGGSACLNTCNEAAHNCLTPAGTPCASDDNVCTNDVCDGGGVCTHAPNDETCDDGIYCNGLDSCAFGSCTVHAGNPCIDGTECNDACDEEERSCYAPSGTHCADDGEACTVDACDGAGSCAHTPAGDGSPCDDGDTCTVGDACRTGECIPGERRNCDDGLFCNGSESCEPEVGCVEGMPPCDTCCDEDLDSCVSDRPACEGASDCEVWEDCRSGCCQCAVAIALSGERIDGGILASFRGYRDRVLNASIEGRRLVGLYYDHSREVAGILIRNDELRAEAQAILEQHAGDLLSAATGRTITLTTAEWMRALDLVARIEEGASGRLRTGLGEIREIVEDEQMHPLLGLRIDKPRNRDPRERG